MSTDLLNAIIQHQTQLRQCTQCKDMIPPVIVGEAVLSPILLIGQAPGIHEGKLQRPFAWTAGKTLFKWFANIGLPEADFRQYVYMSAVCRCFPGKKITKGQKRSGDRVPSTQEIQQCAYWLQQEINLLQPELIILVGKLAITQFIPIKTLDQAVGQLHHTTLKNGKACDLLPLPHPSGLSTWYHSASGKYLLQQALQLLAQHPLWQGAIQKANRSS